MAVTTAPPPPRPRDAATQPGCPVYIFLKCRWDSAVPESGSHNEPTANDSSNNLTYVFARCLDIIGIESSWIVELYTTPCLMSVSVQIHNGCGTAMLRAFIERHLAGPGVVSRDSGLLDESFSDYREGRTIMPLI